MLSTCYSRKIFGRWGMQVMYVITFISYDWIVHQLFSRTILYSLGFLHSFNTPKTSLTDTCLAPSLALYRYKHNCHCNADNSIGASGLKRQMLSFSFKITLLNILRYMWAVLPAFKQSSLTHVSLAATTKYHCLLHCFNEAWTLM